MWFLDVSLPSSSRSSVFELLLIRLERGGGGSILIMLGGLIEGLEGRFEVWRADLRSGRQI